MSIAVCLGSYRIESIQTGNTSWRKAAPEGEIYERIGGRDRREEREKVRVKERV